MGFLQSLFTPQPQTESRSFDQLLAMGWGSGTAAGVSVTPENALASSTVYACVQVLAGSVAQMPLKLYRRLERGKEVADTHPLYYLLHDRPNPEMSAFVFKEALMLHLLTWGNAYAEIEWGADGYPVALWPLLPDRMEVERKNGVLSYIYRPDFVRPVPLASWQVFHIPGMGFDGVQGYSPIRVQMETLGAERAQMQYGARFFGNGARPSVVLKHPARLTPEAAARLRSNWNELYQGVANAHRTAVLEEGMGIETLSIPPEEAQFLQTRQFTKREIAAFYRVPPQMIGDLETATYASAEQFSRDFVVFSLGEWLKRWEEQIALRLLVGEESREMFPQFVRDALVITQTGERFQAYATAIQSGVMTPNEARDKENMNPLPGGDDLLLPLNMAKADGDTGDGADGNAGGQQARKDILGYHIESGVVTQNEARADLGLPPIDDSQDKILRGLRAKLEVLIAATSAGIPLSAALKLVGLAMDSQPADDADPAARSLFTADIDVLVGAWAADIQRRLAARIENDVRQGGAKALRNGGRLALGEWGEEQMHDWRQAGEVMMAPLRDAGHDAIDLGAWVTTVYQAAVRELIHGN